MFSLFFCDVSFRIEGREGQKQREGQTEVKTVTAVLQVKVRLMVIQNLSVSLTLSKTVILWAEQMHIHNQTWLIITHLKSFSCQADFWSSSHYHIVSDTLFTKWKVNLKCISTGSPVAKIATSSLSGLQDALPVTSLRSLPTNPISCQPGFWKGETKAWSAQLQLWHIVPTIIMKSAEQSKVVPKSMQQRNMQH